jgi:hypothetical protein
MKIHYYMLSYRFEALVASHLEPKDFGLYMAVGSQKNTRGNQLFFEIDPSLKSSYFQLEDIEFRCRVHKDGSPKRSKYISVYRVLEHLDLSVFRNLYCTTADGRTISLKGTAYQANGYNESKEPNLIQELCPVSPLVVSSLGPSEFIKFMTDVNNPVHVPRIFFADLKLELDEDGQLSGNLPYSDPVHIVDCLNELKSGSKKPTKTVSRNPQIHGFFRTIRRGFFLGDSTGIVFYKFPSQKELEVDYSLWWRSASESMVNN